MLTAEIESETSDPEAYSLSISDIARRFHKGPLAVWRWIKFGIKKNGVRVYLRGVQAGREFRIRPVDLDEFLRLLNPETWRPLAEADERERKAARRDRERLRRKLNS